MAGSTAFPQGIKRRRRRKADEANISEELHIAGVPNKQIANKLKFYKYTYMEGFLVALVRRPLIGEKSMLEY